MALRTECIYNGQTIGIETIYTIQNGKRINIPGKVEALRKLGRQNQLFCPCGCGANLILVAGDRNLREQHFRVKEGTGNGKCIAIEENDISIRSKIMLKCWLDLKLQSSRIESRVPLNRICDSERKFEFTFYDYENRIGVCYWYNRANIETDKVDMLEDYNGIHKTLYITDIHNSGTTGQYPEFLIKVQNKQGFNLYFDLKDNNWNEDAYKHTRLETRNFVKNHFEIWQELVVISDELDKYSVAADGELIYDNELVRDKVQKVVIQFQAVENERLEKEKSRREELLRQTQIQREKVENVANKRVSPQETREDIQKKIEEEYKRKRRFTAEGDKIDSLDFANHNKVIKDLNGDRWVQCKNCGQKSTTNYFVSYGGEKELNLGICYNCRKHGNDTVEIPIKHERTDRKKQDMICPNCGGKLVEKRGRFGSFMGCTNYPKCNYTTKIRN